MLRNSYYVLYIVEMCFINVLRRIRTIAGSCGVYLAQTTDRLTQKNDYLFRKNLYPIDIHLYWYVQFNILRG